MRMLSTGDESTLSNYRRLATVVFGEESKAVDFLDKRIMEQGEAAEVIVDERQMIHLLANMDRD